MKTKNTIDTEAEYRLTPRFLKENAELICEMVESETDAFLFKCDDCGDLHLRFRTPDDHTKH